MEWFLSFYTKRDSIVWGNAIETGKILPTTSGSYKFLTHLKRGKACLEAPEPFLGLIYIVWLWWWRINSGYSKWGWFLPKGGDQQFLFFLENGGTQSGSFMYYVRSLINKPNSLHSSISKIQRINLIFDTVTWHLQAAALMETQHFFSKGSST